MTLLECAKVLIRLIPDRPQGCSSATQSTAYATLSFSLSLFHSDALSPSAHPLSAPLPSLWSLLPFSSLFYIQLFFVCVFRSKTNHCTLLRTIPTTSTTWCGHPCTPRSSRPWTAWVVWICGTWTTTLRWGNALRLVSRVHAKPEMHQNNNKLFIVWASPCRLPLNQLFDSFSPMTHAMLTHTVCEASAELLRCVQISLLPSFQSYWVPMGLVKCLRLVIWGQLFNTTRINGQYTVKIDGGKINVGGV